MDLGMICTDVRELALNAGSFIREEREKISTKDVEIKGLHNFVTYVDKQTEELIVSGLRKILPEAGFITEEGTDQKKGERYNWVIDPLDGTTNFIHGLPPYAVSIALMDQKQLLAGVVYEVSLNECFHATINGKAYVNDKTISVSQAPSVKDSLVVTGFPYTDYNRLEGFMSSLSYFFQNTHGVRRLGSAATDMCYVACGRCDAFYEYGLNSYDIAAGALIVLRAGGKLSDFSGKDDYIFGGEMVATNGIIHEEFLHSLKQFKI
jgi:myo-inositol-1(or 4)-monophosphatase